MPTKDLTEKLTFVEGTSAEMIINALNKSGLKYTIRDPKLCNKTGYFKETTILLDEAVELDKKMSVLRKKIGEPHHSNRDAGFYYAKYRPDKIFDWNMDINWKCLDGKITFENGFLIELTRISFLYT